jgi:hypothetical protein
MSHRFIEVLAPALFSLAAGCLVADDDDAGTAPTEGGPGDTSSGNTTSATTESGGSSSGGSTSAASTDTSSTSAADDSTGDPTAGVESCSTATLFAGDPLYPGDVGPDPAGEPIDGIPVPYRHLLFTDDRLVTHVGEELWAADLSAATPTFVRLAGELQEGLPSFATGDCATARFGDTRGIVALGDGRLALADQLGNAILVVDDPFGAGCSVSSIAGNADPATGIAEPLAAGDADGTGTAAALLGPNWLTSVGDAMVFIDIGNNKLKRVTIDGEVTTLTELPSDQPVWNAMTAIGGTAYVVGTSGQQDTVLAIDASDGTTEVLLQGYGDLFPPLDGSQVANLQAVTTDGAALLVSGKGYVWRLGLDGVATQLAGIGIVPDYPPVGYDPSAPHDALELVLKHPNGGGVTGGAALYMTYDDGAIFWASVIEARAFYMHRIACP